MNRFTYRVSTLSTQLITKLSKMNRFTVLESQNRLSTNLDDSSMKTEGFVAFVETFRDIDFLPEDYCNSDAACVNRQGWLPDATSGNLRIPINL